MYLTDSLNVVYVMVAFGPTILYGQKGQSSHPFPRETETPFSHTHAWL